MGGQSRSPVWDQKGGRDRLIRLAQAHPDWVLGFADETWWSRVSPPAVSAWAEPKQPLRLQEQTVPKEDPDPKAVACYGLLLSETEEVLLRFVDGRPVSGVTTQFLTWCCAKLETQGKRALLLVWDNASWHISREVQAWLRDHNRQVKQTGKGVRILECRLPSKSPWLNPIEPKWGHAKRRVVEPARLLPARELAERACAALSAAYEPHLSLPNNTA